MLQIDVFWPLLLIYFLVLVVYTLQKILKTMQKHRYSAADFQKLCFQKISRRRKPRDIFEEVQPAEVVLIEGIMLFHYKQIREFCDMKLLIDCDADTRLARRVKRDTTERGRSIENIIKQYTG